MADAMMMFLGEAHEVNWYWAQPGEFENPGVYYWDGAKNVLCVPHLSAPEAPAVVQVPDGWSADPSAEAVELAKMVMSDCGLAVENRHDLLGRIADRISKFAAAPEAPAQASAVDERAAFEAWAKAYGRVFLEVEPKLGRNGVTYKNQFTQEAWVGWQARAALAQKGGAA